MTLDDRMLARFAGMKAVNEARRAPADLPRGGGGGTSGGMEPRIAKLEADMEHVKKSLDRLVDVPVRIAVIEERISHLPTKGWMVGSLGTGLALLAALIAFSDKIHALIG